MNIQRCVPIIAGLAILLAFCRPANAEPTISANPPEVVFYTKSTTMQKSTEIAWDADFPLRGPEVHYTTNGTGETLFATGE